MLFCKLLVYSIEIFVANQKLFAVRQQFVRWKVIQTFGRCAGPRCTSSSTAARWCAGWLAILQTKKLVSFGVAVRRKAA